MSQNAKDFSSISPSARSLLLMKGATSIPYAKQAADLVQGPEVFELSFDKNDFWFWIRVMHFETRYYSIDQLLTQTHDTNILELSSGYSFRGLDLCLKRQDIHYIDTDLPEVITMKQNIIDQLQLTSQLKGNFEMTPLDVMDEAGFNEVVGKFNDKPVTVVNEGLLMYLNMEEKKQLCARIHRFLKQHGGCWITADIYVKRSDNMRAALPQSKGEKNFFEQHNIEENKFHSYEAAGAFFKEQGFELVKEATPNYQALSVMPHLLKVLPEEVRNSKEPPPKIQATWMLRAI